MGEAKRLPEIIEIAAQAIAEAVLEREITPMEWEIMSDKAKRKPRAAAKAALAVLEADGRS